MGCQADCFRSLRSFIVIPVKFETYRRLSTAAQSKHKCFFFIRNDHMLLSLPIKAALSVD